MYKGKKIFWALVLRNKFLKGQMTQRVNSKDKGLLFVLDDTEQISS